MGDFVGNVALAIGAIIVLGGLLLIIRSKYFKLYLDWLKQLSGKPKEVKKAEEIKKEIKKEIGKKRG
jgi:NADPH-dependent 7-cyano-7-deazaguanine reductase QueF-like protein